MYIYSRLHFPFFSKTYFSEITFSRTHLAEITIHLAKVTFLRKLIFQYLHLLAITFGLKYISSKTYFLEFIHINPSLI